MDVRAIVLVGSGPPQGVAASEVENFAGAPLALQDVLGQPVLHRVVGRLTAKGVGQVTVISSAAMPALAGAARGAQKELSFVHAPGAQFWRAAENAFSEHAQAGADEVLVWRLGGYGEFVVDEFLQQHLDSRGRVTRATLPDGTELDVVLIAASRRNDAAYLFRHELRRTRVPSSLWPLRGYWNPLQTVQHLRQLAIDGLLQRIELAPAGEQLRPGIWTGAGVTIERGARILAPAFLGERVRIRAGAVVTRCAVLEHHVEVGKGSVIEDSSVLPYSFIGHGIDITHAVVGARRLVHLPRRVEIEIADPRLIDTRSPHAPMRMLGSFASLAGFLPAQLLRGLFAKSHREPLTELPASATAPAAALNLPAGFEASPEASSFPAHMAVARRYGDQ